MKKIEIIAHILQVFGVFGIWFLFLFLDFILELFITKIFEVYKGESVRILTA